MTYQRKSKITDTPVEIANPFGVPMICDHFVEGAKAAEAFIADVSTNDQPTANEIVAGLHAVGSALHEKLMDLADTTEERRLIVDGTVEIFQGMAAQRLRYQSDDKDASVVYTALDGTKTEMTTDEAGKVIRRSAICYGLVSGLARAAAEAIRENENS